MPIDVACPTCRKTLRVGDHVAGKKIRCPTCQGILSVPVEEIVEVAEIHEEPITEPVLAFEPERSGSSAGKATGRRGSRSHSTEARSRRSEQSRPRLRRHQESRDYVHKRCGGVTTIDGPEFQALADPLIRMTATYCSECEEMFPITEFAWDDTKERISDYYARYQAQASSSQKFLASRSGMFWITGFVCVASLASCLVIGFYGVIAAVVAGITAVVLHSTVFAPIILRQVLGTDDPTQLE